jgi:AbrB family looped-hinge helix DNA binding protein
MKKRETSHGKLGEAPALYTAEQPAGLRVAKTRLSVKNQITIPVAMCRLLDIRPGDEIELMVEDDTIVLERLPRTAEEWLKATSGSLNVPEWSTKEKIDAWINAERDSWERD